MDLVEEDKYMQEAEQKYHISVWVQKSRIRLYQNESKVIDLPKAFNVSSVKMDRIRFEDGAALISNVRIADSRIETDGMGESQPVAPNDTPSNKALNRRVEFIKL